MNSDLIWPPWLPPPTPPSLLLSPQLVKRGEKTVVAIHAVLMTLNGKYVVTSSKDGSARIWEVESGSTIGVVDGQGEGIACLAINPQGVSGGRQGLGQAGLRGG